jgi:predicted ArsR family transcriptional regulator
MRNAPDDILFWLKTAGPAQTLAVAGRLGVTRQAARQHLEKLAAEGLVEHVTARAGVGRPRQVWSLTGKAQARFPDTHAQMTVDLIEAVREEFGAEGLDRLVTRREQATAEAYSRALGADPDLEIRLERLSALRSAEGYMAEWRREADGTYLLIENHCPICAAAAACQGFCRAELDLFSRLLAPAAVTRTEHVLDGARRCAYRVTLG